MTIVLVILVPYGMMPILLSVNLKVGKWQPHAQKYRFFHWYFVLGILTNPDSVTIKKSNIVEKKSTAYSAPIKGRIS